MAFHLTLNLSQTQILRLNVSHPINNGSNQIGERALEIVRLYFSNIDPAAICRPLSSLKNSYHYEVTYTDPSSKQKITREILIKGTKKPSWVASLSAMRITGTKIYNRVTSNNVPIFRVINVNSNTPEIWEIFYPTDFKLERDDRWRGKP